ncbi:hypothetical protein INT45_001386 [Circinella minor]|uniref:MIF4G domain-containing protein n=1 Tax=Circinella minor TaxID=1195481 RepID=A0A8H7RVG2_9FUNG|nr:hypothetical protein INT45_001386 [Circinella minor]
MHYPPLSSPLNMTVSQQQQQFDFVSRFNQLPQCNSRSISIINPNTREQVTADPIIVKPVPVTIKIKKPPIVEKEQYTTIIELKNMDHDKKSYFPASTKNTTPSISAATTFINKKEQIQRHICTTMIGVNSSVNNKDKLGEPIVENIMNNEQQQSTVTTTIVPPSSNNEDDVSNTMNNINTLTITKETTKLIEPDGTSSDETEEECSDEYDDNVTIASTVSTSDNKEQFDNNEISETKQRIQYSREFLLQLRYSSTQAPINDLSAIQPATLPVLAPMNTSTPKRKSNSSFIFNKDYIKNNYSVDTTTQQQQQSALFTMNIHNKKNNYPPWCFSYNNNEQNNKSFQQDKTRSRTTSLPKSPKQWIPSHKLREKPLQHEKNTQNKNTVKNQYVLSKSSNRWISPSKLHEKRRVEQNMNQEKKFTTSTFANEVLPKSTHRWVPSREMRENDNQGITQQQQQEKKDKVEQVEKKVELLSTKEIEPKIKGLLNKLSSVNFDSISEQIWNYAKGSSDHLKTVVRMLFDKACDESHFATQWAKLCKKIQDILSTSASFDTLIQDDTIKDKQGHPASGVYLYRCYLLNRCQEQFEMEGGWWSNNHSQQISLKDVKMLSDEYYIAMKQKRQGLGLVVFIGELYKQEMLTSKTVSHCLTKLLENKEYVGDEEVETVCKLLSTIGESFDQVIQTKFWMNHYLQDMEKMIRTNKKLSTRVKFKVMDVIDLRKNQWIVKEKKVKL